MEALTERLQSAKTDGEQGNQQRRTGPHEFQAFERRFDGVCNFEDQPAMSHHCYC
jgi:hypothetical protein